jgi:hypothetical protein
MIQMRAKVAVVRVEEEEESRNQSQTLLPPDRLKISTLSSNIFKAVIDFLEERCKRTFNLPLAMLADAVKYDTVKAVATLDKEK